MSGPFHWCHIALTPQQKSRAQLKRNAFMQPINFLNVSGLLISELTTLALYWNTNDATRFHTSTTDIPYGCIKSGQRHQLPTSPAIMSDKPTSKKTIVPRQAKTT
ncbi:unnamed protein product [Anisakis simplex]|uniref:Uncharacterized protein n=1 Tax=Anisakis simplex TaxID=6269 RepID=A0A0M3KHT9_ANISI|nr:unnamed protein product [Anisakis simplex]